MNTWNNIDDCSGDPDVVDPRPAWTSDGLQCFAATNCPYAKSRTYTVSSCVDGITPDLSNANYEEKLQIIDQCIRSSPVSITGNNIHFCNETGVYFHEYAASVVGYND